LAGWVHRRRDHGGVTFIDCATAPAWFRSWPTPIGAGGAGLAEARPEWVLQVVGEVRAGRQDGECRLASGEIEVSATEVVVLNAARTPPFPINEETDVDETLRLRYRYLDLRRDRMRRNLELRHRVVRFIRALEPARFWEIETPMLFKTTPEGARTTRTVRLYPGEFYALPQSPNSSNNS
jgi:aspartyl-tRNA synthetase